MLHVTPKSANSHKFNSLVIIFLRLPPWTLENYFPTKELHLVSEGAMKENRAQPNGEKRLHQKRHSALLVGGQVHVSDGCQCCDQDAGCAVPESNRDEEKAGRVKIEFSQANIKSVEN